MSLWKIGADDVSQETQNFKDKLASKDGQIAGQQAKLVKQAEELEEIKASLNEALQKLAEESQRAMGLQNNLTQCKDDLRNEKNASRNIEASLQAANTKLKQKDIETRDLEATLDRLSKTSDEYNTRNAKLESEKSALEARIRELESSARQLQSAVAAASRRAPSRTSSAQFNDLRINALEKESRELGEKLAENEKELVCCQAKLSHAQNEVLRLQNEELAKEARTKSEFDQLRSLLQERNEELDYYKNQQAGSEREEELLQRIEEDEAKITALEAMLRESDDVKDLREKLRNMERRFTVEVEKMAKLEMRSTVLIQERDDALRELGDVHNQLHTLQNHAQERQEEIDNLMKERYGKCLATAINEPEEPPLLDGSTGAVEPADGIDVLHVAKLLNTIARLRGERDDLRRNLQFLETEHQFTVEALEKRLTETPALSSSLCNQPKAKPLATQPCPLPMNMLLKDEESPSTYSAAAYAILLLHSQTQLERCDRLLSESIEREKCARDRIEIEAEKYSTLAEESDRIANQLRESEEEMEDLRSRHAITSHNLEKMTGQRNDLISQLGARDVEWEDMKMTRKVLQERLEEAETHLEEVSRTLEVVESERDSLALQVKNLTADLEAVQGELASAETRYSALQFHQLSSMTSSEATHALRKQIEELEGRVMRRTEQIGIHQHDIRRLETNLRLQEERLGEMTMELETLVTQKEAMLEDCADAREARDEALMQIETLEEDLETLESKLAHSDRALNTMIYLLIQTTARIKSFHLRSRSRVTKLEAELKGSQTIQHNLGKDIIDIQALATRDLRQMIIALAVSQSQYNKLTTQGRNLAIERDRLVCNLSLANERIEEQEEANKRLEEECNALRHGSSTGFAELAAKSSEYQAEIDSLKRVISAANAENETSQKKLAQSAAELRELQKEWEEVRSDLVEEARGLQKDLSAALEQERTNRTALEKQHAEALSLAQCKIDELEKRAETLSEEISRLSLSQQSLQTEKEGTQQELYSLHAELDALLAEKVGREKNQHDLVIANERLSGEVLQLQKERELMVQDTKSQADEHLQELEARKTELQFKVDELTRKTENQTQSIQRLSQELDQERQRSRDREDKYTAGTNSLTQELETAQSKLSTLQEEIVSLYNAMKHTENSLAESEAEKGRLQENMTNLEAQIQKSLSYTHSLERQLQDGERALEALKKNLGETQAELSRAETNAKTAEVNLSLQSVQFKRELSKLQDKLVALEPRRDLEEALANLEERNNEMEELLKAKCAEIEENDDHALEMLKENKKLTSKAEALTRKVQNLQTKLAAAKAAVANSGATVEVGPTTVKPSPKTLPEAAELHEPQTQTARRRSSRQSTASVASLPPERASTASGSRPLTSRAASGSLNNTLRPKTPEKRLAPTPVFKLRTPEQPRAQGRTGEPPASIVGVKRRAPDDFEVCESVPPQGFTADSLPSRGDESTTPRVRRMFNNLQPGFTPIRNKVLSSPKRQSAAVLSTPLIQDVTNSPRNSVPLDHLAKQSKRSWLGKIRGAAPQGAIKPASRQVFISMSETQRP